MKYKEKLRNCRHCKKKFSDNNGFYDKYSCSKECYNKSMKEWRTKNNNYHREWKAKNPDYMRNWWINHQGYLRDWGINNDFQGRYKEIIKAGILANKFIEIPKGYKCEVCNINLAINRHHEDYSKPLQVILCCKKCHGLLDEARHKKEEVEIKQCGI